MGFWKILIIQAVLMMLYLVEPGESAGGGSKAEVLACPVMRPGYRGDCRKRCSMHEQCKEIGKCCSNGCGTECMETVPYRPPKVYPPTYEVRLCPNDMIKKKKGRKKDRKKKSKKRRKRSTTEDSCPDKCLFDEHCKIPKKCCKTKCGMKCVKPLKFDPHTYAAQGQPSYCSEEYKEYPFKCVDYREVWTYDHKKNYCRPVVYQGCNFSKNFFFTKTQCELICEKK